ncbi:2Fe-2S iron-sulfur cluster-binding protein [Streptomyces alanosinicus]|uniref:Phenylacetic acid degradation protein n=1 Tax=Streptomyces alanosinicus TaxID=68171 RepID=A0A918YRP4_9ACTN|nr:2Fe-2S iron-sulfur cluster-binding protein [Streptomyces alanosinicus]GHE12646.1 phenylacetic acid degradation protein [Streptomyces alanosinicus]
MTAQSTAPGKAPGGRATASGATSRTRFHPLTVTAVEPAAADGSAIAITLTVPDALRAAFVFRPGQYLTVRSAALGDDIRRSYSLCSTPHDLAERGELRIGVRAVDGGTFSPYVTQRLAAGDTLHALTPQGRFTTAPDPARTRRYAAVAAGSGITPVLALARAVLATEPHSTFTLVYGNRTAASAMFTEDLADLKDRHGHRLQPVHVFSRESQQVGPASGRLTPAALHRLLPGLLAVAAVDEWFVCGPPGLVDTGEEALTALGVAPDRIRTEPFLSAAPARTPPPAPAAAGASGHRITVRLDGRDTTVTAPAGTTVLDAALTARPELPFSCRTGVCATCRARVVTGRADMARNRTLTDAERADHYVLTCQSVPASEELTVDFDVV